MTRHLPSTGYNDDWEPDPEGKNPHPLKFTRATPKQQDRGYLRLLHPVTGVTPTPTELITDRDRCWTRNMRKIWDVRGIRVPGNGNRNGNGSGAPAPGAGGGGVDVAAALAAIARGGQS